MDNYNHKVELYYSWSLPDLVNFDKLNCKRPLKEIPFNKGFYYNKKHYYSPCYSQRDHIIFRLRWDFVINSVICNTAKIQTVSLNLGLFIKNL